LRDARGGEELIEIRPEFEGRALRRA
jgi:hypothetical protein